MTLNLSYLKTLDEVQQAREIISPPANSLRELMEQQGIGHVELAQRLGKSEKHISELLNAKTSITPELALGLEKVIGPSQSFWIKREALYQEQLQRLNEIESHIKEINWLSNFPLLEMAKLGWISTSKKSVQVLDEILALLSIAKVEAFQSTFIEVSSNVRYRTSLKKHTNPYALAAWLSFGQKIAQEKETQIFSKSKVKSMINQLKKMIQNGEINFYDEVEKQMANCGITLVHVPALKNVPVYGVTKWINGKPLILMSQGLHYADRYWFTLLHELGHVLLHSSTKVFIDSGDSELDEEEKLLENEADAFAQDSLIDKNSYQMFLMQKFIISEADITTFAQVNETHPGIVLGRLQRDKHLAYSAFPNLRLKINKY